MQNYINDKENKWEYNIYISCSSCFSLFYNFFDKSQTCIISFFLSNVSSCLKYFSLISSQKQNWFCLLGWLLWRIEQGALWKLNKHSITKVFPLPQIDYFDNQFDNDFLNDFPVHVKKNKIDTWSLQPCVIWLNLTLHLPVLKLFISLYSSGFLTFLSCDPLVQLLML